ncbi:hypothetical protein C8J56DRAFT_797856 [Mycena floridula]|nr:hypothetical protein C8J56DRAFT_797856 [Mycena floridula]
MEVEQFTDNQDDLEAQEVEDAEPAEEEEADDDEEQCCICLASIQDRTILPSCSHEFCFTCIIPWLDKKHKCPLCAQDIGDHIIHRIRSRLDYKKVWLVPLRTSPEPTRPTSMPSSRPRPRRRIRERTWGSTREEREEMDRLDRAIEFRRGIYERGLYAKHVASNSYTRYKPYPSSATFASSPELISRTMQFLRRELRVWPNVDVEFLTPMILALMKVVDIRSETAVRRIAEFLDMDGRYGEGTRYRNAEHFVHEVYSYLRSPYKDLFMYDTIVQVRFPCSWCCERN